MLGLRLQVQKGKGAWLLLIHGKNMSCLPSPIPTFPWPLLPPPLQQLCATRSWEGTFR